MALYYARQKSNNDKVIFADSKEKVIKVAKAIGFDIGTLSKAKDGWQLW